MKEELKGPKVKDIAVAIVEEKGDDGSPVFNVFVVNNSETSIEGVLVSSRGYAVNQKTNEQVKTSMLRHFLGNIPPHAAKKVEPIVEELFGLNNEYWVSFWIGNKMYDKKYIFLSETIKKENFVFIPMLGVSGVVIE